MMDRISICDALSKWNEIDPFLKWMVTGDEKWVTYYNIAQERSWSKSLLSTTGPFQASKRPELANRRGVVFHQDNARPHTSVVTHHKLWKLIWKVLMYSPYSSDLAPSDYLHLLALQNFLSDKKLG
ncbi:putative DD34D transposase [Trichonephila clavipes]|nr:putative DD34D transposase [Trichonephila clavipes]